MYPHDDALHLWAKAVKALYDEAIAWVQQGPDPTLSPHGQKQARVAKQHATC
jgi:hypothetical protein